jgi:hypothetical protein
MKIPLFKNQTPAKPGYYLYRGDLTLDVDLIHVVLYPEKEEHGMRWESYLGVSNYRGRNVTQLRGYFSEALEF